MKISEFLNNELVDYSSYDNLRKISSYIDGQKNSARKILHTVLKKNITEEIKVSQLSSKMAEFTQYLHGDASGVIVSMAKNYTGTNNMPLLATEGNFGTRFKPEASAPRYIYTMKDKNTEFLFKKEDEKILIEQIFEGDVIEPRFFIPTLPVLLINGSMNCITPGFTQHILPRNLEDIKKYIKLKLSGKDTSKISLTPHFNGFNGTIKQGETSNKWLIYGKFERVGMAGIRITELPVSYCLKSYLKILNKLVDDKVIKDYKDKSENDKFIFEISGDKEFLSLPDEKLYDKLKLIKRESESYNCIDENNKVRLFSDVYDIIDSFILIKKEYIQIRKNYNLNVLKDKMNYAAAKFVFIKNINDGLININNKSKQEIIDQLAPFDKIVTKDGKYDYLLNISVYELTVEEMNNTRNSIIKMKEDYKSLSSTSIDNIWLNEL